MLVIAQNEIANIHLFSHIAIFMKKQLYIFLYFIHFRIIEIGKIRASFLKCRAILLY